LHAAAAVTGPAVWPPGPEVIADTYDIRRQTARRRQRLPAATARPGPATQPGTARNSV